jgi:hypothetical protein
VSILSNCSHSRISCCIYPDSLLFFGALPNGESEAPGRAGRAPTLEATTSTGSQPVPFHL